jgi:transcriptional regulator with XRE-family HTH domain
MVGKDGAMPPEWDAQLKALGSYLRAQRRLANLSLRQMAALAQISNPYLSQIERGLHEPSVHVLRSIARALNLSAETVLEQAGLLAAEEESDAVDTESAIRRDGALTEEQKLALLAVYRSYRADNARLD